MGGPVRFRDAGGQVVNACVKVAPGCAHCYAEAIGLRFRRGSEYTKKAMGGLTAFLDEAVLRSMVRFRPRPSAAAEGSEGTYKNGRARPVVFLGDMTDLFGEWVEDAWLDRIMAVCALRPDADWLLLTKRPERMAEYFNDSRDILGYKTYERVGALAQGHGDEGWGTHSIDPRWSPRFERNWPLPNVWLGCSVSDQKTLDANAPHLVKCPAAVRFLSYEPAIAAADLGEWFEQGGCNKCGHFGRCLRTRSGLAHSRPDHTVCNYYAAPLPLLHWIIVGGESGANARAFDVGWARTTIRQGKAAGVPVFVKQLGARVHDYDSTSASTFPDEQCWPDGFEQDCHRIILRDGKGGDPLEWPEDLRVRQVPGGAL